MFERRNTLVEANLDLIRPIAERLWRRFAPSEFALEFALEDFLAEGALGLVLAARGFRPKSHNNTPFSAYARVSIRGAILSLIRTSLRYRGALAPAPDVEAIAIESWIDGHRETQAVAMGLKRLRKRERTVVELRYTDELLFRAIGIELGVGRPRASQLHSSAIGKLRKRLAG